MSCTAGVGVCANWVCVICFVMIGRPPRSTLFPYTTHCRSHDDAAGLDIGDVGLERGGVHRDQRVDRVAGREDVRSAEHTSELQSLTNLVCRLLLEKKKKKKITKVKLHNLAYTCTCTPSNNLLICTLVVSLSAS